VSASLSTASAGTFAPDRIARWSAALLFVQVVIWGYAALNAYGPAETLTRPTSIDFNSFYAAGLLAKAGTPELAYNHAAHLAVQEALVGGQGGIYQFFYYPPVFLMLCAALARLSYGMAYLLFAVGGVALYALVSWAIVRRRGLAMLLPFIAFPAVFFNVIWGQNGLLTASLFGGALLALEERPVLAGLLFGLICYKPQFGLLIPLALAAGCHWRAIAAAAVTVIVLCLGSLWILGAAAWTAFFANAMTAPATFTTGAVLFFGFASPFGGLRSVGMPVDIAMTAQLVVTFIAAIAIVAVWHSRRPQGLKAAMLLAGAFVAVPTAFYYDLALDAVAAAWLVYEGELDDRSMLGLAALWGAALLVPFLWNFTPIVSVTAFTFFAFVALRALRFDHTARAI